MAAGDDVTDDVLVLLAFHLARNESAGKNRIFTLIFECAAIARLASQVDTTSQGHIEALGSKFTPDERPIFIRYVRIPTCRLSHRRWKRSGIPAPGSSARDTNCCIGDLKVWKTQA